MSDDHDNLNGDAKGEVEAYIESLEASGTPELLSASDFYQSLLNQKQWDDTPEDWGLDFGNFGSIEKRIWSQQQRYLHAYSIKKTKTTAARYAGVHYETTRLWERDNYLRFGSRMAMAQTIHHDLIEDKLMELGMGLKPGQNVTPLAIKANAEMPEKYRHNTITLDERPQKVLDELKAHRSRSTRWGVAEGEKSDSDERVS